MGLACVAVEEEGPEIVIDLPNEPPIPEESLALLTNKVNPVFARAKGLCLWCGESKTAKRSLAKFCSTPCRTKYHNRAKVRGALIVDQAIVWRRFRRPGDFSKLTKLIDDLAREDKALGRTHYPPAPLQASVKVVGRNVQGRRGRR